jgi:hypothetical protein
MEQPNADVWIRRIRWGWIAASIHAVLSAFIPFFYILAAEPMQLSVGWAIVLGLLEAGIFTVLACGIYRRSPVAATTTFVLSLLLWIWNWIAAPHVLGSVLGLVFLYIYFQAMRGTYAYQRHIQRPSGSL